MICWLSNRRASITSKEAFPPPPLPRFIPSAPWTRSCPSGNSTPSPSPKTGTPFLPASFPASKRPTAVHPVPGKSSFPIPGITWTTALPLIPNGNRSFRCGKVPAAGMKSFLK
nr:MAG TPA: hypothetical protein [Caudoviricetes sp.]